MYMTIISTISTIMKQENHCSNIF